MKQYLINRTQMICAFLGQKVLLTEQVEGVTRIYPMGAIGLFEAIEMDGKGGAQARVTFDNDPLQDLVTVPIDDIVPVDILSREYVVLKDVDIPYNPEFKTYLETI